MAAKRDTGLDQQAQEWIEAVIGEKFPKCSYEDALKDGILLCK
jgi:transgelin